MHATRRLFGITRAAWPLLLMLLAGCATPMPKPVEVGAVVIAPRLQLLPIPQVVQDLEPYPAGYFQCSFLTYFGIDCDEPTSSTSPTPAAGPTLSP